MENEKIDYIRLADLIADRILSRLNPPVDREAELNKAVKLILNGDKAGGQRIINSRRTKA